jgi:hypothetical protein
MRREGSAGKQWAQYGFEPRLRELGTATESNSRKCDTEWPHAGYRPRDFSQI